MTPDATNTPDVTTRASMGAVCFSAVLLIAGYAGTIFLHGNVSLVLLLVMVPLVSAGLAALGLAIVLPRMLTGDDAHSEAMRRQVRAEIGTEGVSTASVTRGVMVVHIAACMATIVILTTLGDISTIGAIFCGVAVAYTSVMLFAAFAMVRAVNRLMLIDTGESGAS